MRHKYNVSTADRRTWNGKTYASRAEMLYAQELGLRLRAGELAEVVEQPRVSLGVRENVYVPDFLIVPAERDRPYYVDVKGVETPAFKRNKKLWARYGRLALHVVKRKGSKFVTTEVVEGGCETTPNHKDDSDEQHPFER